jgi:hypothetical protein
MNKRTLIATIVVLIILVTFVFLAPVVPMTGGTPTASGHYHYYGSVSSVVSPIGTSYWNGHYYLIAHYNPYLNDL